MNARRLRQASILRGAVSGLLSGSPALAFAQTNTLADTGAALPDVGTSVVRLLGALALVVALFLAGAWLYRNWQRLAGRRGHAPQLHILEARPLGQRQALYLVGYQQQRLLLAASPAGIHLISHLPAHEAPPPGGFGDGAFEDALQQAATRSPSR
jgi:flagellar biogenesis protein FliO